jgi:hypothetical protein
MSTRVKRSLFQSISADWSRWLAPNPEATDESASPTNRTSAFSSDCANVSEESGIRTDGEAVMFQQNQPSHAPTVHAGGPNLRRLSAT